MSAFLVAWRASRVLPRPALRAVVGAVGMLAWARRPKAVRRLEDNLHRVTGLEGRPLRRLSRRGVVSTARYYAEVLEFSRATPQMIDARARMEGAEGPQRAIAEQGRVVMALSHSGNWDLTGAYACRHVAPVTSVAEILDPPEVYQQFVAMREALGMTILGHEGSSTFRTLIARARSVGGVLALLADRDMTGKGVEVTMWGHQVTVAPGPAALALATDTPLFGLMVRYERIRGKRRRIAKARWGIVMSFSPQIEVPTDGDNPSKIQRMSQGWADWVADGIARTPEDWHMLQRMGWLS